MRRLFSCFAGGWPGAGLLLMRLVAAAAVLTQGFTRLESGLTAGLIIPEVLGMAAGLLLVAGLWTPVSAAAVAAFGIWNALSLPVDALGNLLLGTIGIALAMLGPGAWSIDARLFGWKRIEVHSREG